MFGGFPCSGQKEMAVIFSKILFCKQRDHKACEQCIDCRKIDHHNHPNVYTIRPDGNTIKIDQIRELKKIFGYRSTDNSRKVYIIEEADKMTIQAMNSLLTFFEDPEGQITGILIVNNMRSILPTIRSRAQFVPFHCLNVKEVVDVLVEERYCVHLARSAAHIVTGVEASRQMLQQQWFAEIRNVMLQLGDECLRGEEKCFITAQKKILKTPLVEHLGILFHLFYLWCKDMLYAQQQNYEHIVFTDHIQSLQQLAVLRSTKQWVNYMDFINDYKKKSHFYANDSLCLDNFLIRLAQSSE